MPLKKISVLVLSGLIIGGLGALFFQNFVSRGPASALPAPKLRLKPWSESMIGKAHSAMDVRIFAVGGVPTHDDQELHLRAEVRLNQSVDREVNFHWSLPSDVTVVSGQLQDSWPNLKAGQTATTDISVLNVSKESELKTISIHVSGSASGVQYAGTGSFATNSNEQMNENEEQKTSGVALGELALKKSSSAEMIKNVQQ